MGRSERGICERWASGRLFFIHSYVLCFLEMVSFPFFFLCVAPPGLLLFLLPFLSFNFFLCVCACVCMCVESFFLYFFLISYTQLPFSLIHFFLGFFYYVGSLIFFFSRVWYRVLFPFLLFFFFALHFFRSHYNGFSRRRGSTYCKVETSIVDRKGTGIEKQTKYHPISNPPKSLPSPPHSSRLVSSLLHPPFLPSPSSLHSCVLSHFFYYIYITFQTKFKQPLFPSFPCLSTQTSARSLLLQSSVY